MKDIVVLVSPVQAHDSSGRLERDLEVGLPCLLPLGDFTEATLLRLARLESEECILKEIPSLYRRRSEFLCCGFVLMSYLDNAPHLDNPL